MVAANGLPDDQQELAAFGSTPGTPGYLGPEIRRCIGRHPKPCRPCICFVEASAVATPINKGHDVMLHHGIDPIGVKTMAGLSINGTSYTSDRGQTGHPLRSFSSDAMGTWNTETISLSTPDLPSLSIIFYLSSFSYHHFPILWAYDLQSLSITVHHDKSIIFSLKPSMFWTGGELQNSREAEQFTLPQVMVGHC